MRHRSYLLFATIALVGTLGMTQAARRLNPVIELLETKKPVFGLYAPANRRGRGGVPDTSTQKTPAQLAADALAHTPMDYLFDGSMEGDFDRAFPAFEAFAKGISDAGAVQQARLHHPLFVKTHMIAENPALAATRIGKQLDLGVSGIVFVGVESANEVKQGLAMMRFASNGGTRPDAVGAAPAMWGMSEKEYRERADLWPLNPKGELMNWTIVESKEGLAHIREIAAVKGIGVLFPGAGTLRGVFSSTDSAGKRVTDEVAWEAAIQQVLAACKEFKVPCGFPATADNIEMRMKQGFNLFVINWGDAGFKAVDVGMKAAGR